MPFWFSCSQRVLNYLAFKYFGGSLEYRWTLNRVDSTLVVENNLRDMVNTGEYHLFVGI
jgi:hypothetical protein